MAPEPVPSVPLDRWVRPDDVSRLHVPEELRRYKSTGGYGNPQISGDRWLLWAEPIGTRTLVVCRHAAPSVEVALVTADGTIELSTWIPASAAPACVHDAYTWAGHVGIRTAERALPLLQEQGASPAAPEEGEASST